MKVKDLPIRIQELVKRNADACGIKFNGDRTIDSHFNIICSKDGKEFWEEISSGNFKPFYKTYGFIGDVYDFPYEVVMAMCDEQVKQGNKWSVEPFEYIKSIVFRGFDWKQTQQGVKFWENVITRKQFDLILDPLQTKLK